jgi:hypothetical protein
MPLTKGTIVPIAHVQAFLRATIWLKAGRRVLTVYRSPLVQDTDECMVSVYAYLNEECFIVGTSEDVEDEDMMFGRASNTAYQILNQCPGDAVDHVCRIAKTTMQGTGV